jgi:cobalt-zinc-cadmium efflux system outer membrane protein
VALPAARDELVAAALRSRPDLAAYRLGLERARADVRLERANRFSDVALVYQPYTFQDGRAFGLKGTYSYALGLSADLPLFNRNQGNIARAEWNVEQTRLELATLEQQVVHEVSEALRSFELSQAGVLELERDVLPAARRYRDAAFEEYREDASKVRDYLDEQADYNDAVLTYRNALIDHRQDALRLNTAVGVRVLP